MREEGRIVAFSSGLLLIRLILGVVLFARGGAILFNWWTTEYGMTAYSSYLDLHGFNFLIGATYWAWLLGLVQFVGGILIIFGLMTRLSSLLNAILMILIMAVMEYEAGWFIVFYGTGTGEYQGGIEYTLLLAGVCFGLFLTGAGKYSLDSGFAVKKKEAPAKPPETKTE